MKETKIAKPLIGVICILVLILLALVALYLDSLAPEPIFGVFRPDPTESSEPSSDPTGESGEANDEQVEPPVTDLPATVIIPSDENSETGALTFPCQVPGYGLTIERIAPYSGMYVEDGTNATVESVAMLLVKNNGDFPVEYTKIQVEYGEEMLTFDISALPVGEAVVVQEKNGKAVPQGQAEGATALVVNRAELDMSEESIQVTDNGDNTLTVKNLTDKMIPTVRVFYKYYMENEDIFVGGIAFTVRLTRLGAGASITVQPSHYTSQTGRVVMVLTYDSEV